MKTEQFHYTADDGREIVLPHMRNIKVGVIRKLRGEDEAGQMFGVLEAVADPDTLAVVDDMDGEQLEKLMSAWQAASVSLGESAASAGS